MNVTLRPTVPDPPTLLPEPQADVGGPGGYEGGGGDSDSASIGVDLRGSDSSSSIAFFCRSGKMEGIVSCSARLEVLTSELVELELQAVVDNSKASFNAERHQAWQRVAMTYRQAILRVARSEQCMFTRKRA